MKWFSQLTQQTEHQSAAEQLSLLRSDGVNLTIDELLNYQNKSALINLKANRNQKSPMAGNYLARSKGRGMEFDEVRHYQTGDDIRTIDWRVTARTGKTHTKLFREEIERPVLVATDLSQSMLFGSQLLFKSVQAAHIASLVAWHAKERGDRLGGIVFNEQHHVECKPRSRKHGVLHYLHALLAVHQQSLANRSETTNDAINSGLAFEQNCMRIRQLARPGSLVYLITDGCHVTDDSIRHLSQISQHCELVVCQISDPIERGLPKVDSKINVAMTDGNIRQQVTLGDKKSAQKYAEQVQQTMTTQKHLFSKAGARLLQLSAGQTIEQQLTDGVASWIR